ncbi:N-acetylneuraminate synthase [Modicisalibacter ilicicola DSM 19980]|uniref:N-acetylneuraminate synthase n=1 Tax=Modicisalibacter ilicicola DSM 19980 TaxID=1121942 RepID=A0A1M5EP93_9GAMM|nr:N-acetylneuraminate synthase [Halomonas ilicicola]SHF80921.1 N-acetylneuraminate synthase [Halomonas ilicicola DSM 19980]
MSSQHKVYVIAEAGVNHNGNQQFAFDLVDAAAEAGADAVKFQTFNARCLAAMTAPKAAYQRKTTDAAQTQSDMLEALELPLEWHGPLQAHAHHRGIEFLSTAFDTKSLAFLETLNLPLYKVPSGELTNGPLLWAFARTGKPLVMSTGMATLSEVEQGLAVVCHALNRDQPPSSLNEVWQCWSDDQARDAVRKKVSLLHCTSQYPTPMHEVNLKAMDTLAEVFRLPVGYSDHTQGTLIPVAAVARGATLIEKHFTLDRQLPGPDHAASLEPGDLKRMVQEVRAIADALGEGQKVPQPSEWDTREAARQNLVASATIRQGEVFTADNLTTARAGQGELAMAYWDRLGQCAARDYQPGEAL